MKVDAAEETAPTRWVSPETDRLLRQESQDKANSSRWDINAAIFLIVVLVAVIFLMFLGVNIGIVGAVAAIGLAGVWLAGWIHERQVYRRLYKAGLATCQDDWKDYYNILRISPGADSAGINNAYIRLSHIYNEALSEKAKDIPAYSNMRDDTIEAFEVLSHPVTRTAYDRVFWLRHNIASAEIPESEKMEIISLMQSVAGEVRRLSEQKYWRISARRKFAWQVALASVAAILVVLVGGTSFAFAKPENLLATPFKGIAINLTKTSESAVLLIEDIRGVAAMQERSVITTALQLMRIDEDLKEISPAGPTDDMAVFPSPGNPLYPDYLETRYSQFKYSVDSNGTVRVDTSSASTDAFLAKIEQMITRLEEDKK